jgi:lipopolysaccharide export system permease protein
METIFSIVFLLGKLNEQNELYILYSTGKNIWYFLYPIIIVLFIFCTIMLIYNEEAIYIPHQKHRTLHNKFKNQEYIKLNDRDNLVQFGKNNKLYIIDFYNVGDKIMEKAKIFFITKNNKFEKIIISDKITHLNKTLWKIKEPIFYKTSTNTNNLEFKKTPTIVANLGDKPFYFNQVENPEDMSIQQINLEAKKTDIIGGNSQSLWTEYYLKTAIPFISLITFFIGVSLSVFTKKSVIVLSFVYSILSAFVYMVFMNIGVSLGKNGLLSPLLGGWLGNLTFFLTAITSYWRFKK